MITVEQIVAAQHRDIEQTQQALSARAVQSPRRTDDHGESQARAPAVQQPPREPGAVKQEAAAPVEIYQALGEEFGLARDDDEELDDLSAWPAFDHDSGASWRRMSWPELAGATFEPHPFAPYCNLLGTAAHP